MAQVVIDFEHDRACGSYGHGGYFTIPRYFSRSLSIL
ncbi:MAG: hypothetical protein HN413_05490 [Chloroflexi bacterium]|nr:hypothetical protein [Chloroflexota bacterium]